MRRLLNSDWFGLYTLVLAAMVVISLLRPDFHSSFNIFVLLSTVALSTLIALAQMVIIALGQMNLSVGSIGGLVAIAFSGAMQVWGWPPAGAVVGGLLLGAACGAANGVLTAQIGLSAFVVTLATMAAYKGINLGITQAHRGADRARRPWRPTSAWGSTRSAGWTGLVLESQMDRGKP